MKHAYAIEVLRRAAEREDKREAYVRELRAAKPNADFFAERAASLRAAIAVLEAVNDAP